MKENYAGLFPSVVVSPSPSPMTGFLSIMYGWNERVRKS